MLSSLHACFRLNDFALNPDKSDAIIFGTWQRSHTLPSIASIDVAGCTVPFSSNVKIIGVTLHSTLAINKHVGLLSKTCYNHIRALRHIRKSLIDDSAKSIACAIVRSRLDYANAVLVGLSVSNIM